MHEVTKYESDLSDSSSDYGIGVINCDSVESANEEFATLLIQSQVCQSKAFLWCRNQYIKTGRF